MGGSGVASLNPTETERTSVGKSMNCQVNRPAAVGTQIISARPGNSSANWAELLVDRCRAHAFHPVEPLPALRLPRSRDQSSDLRARRHRITAALVRQNYCRFTRIPRSLPGSIAAENAFRSIAYLPELIPSTLYVKTDKMVATGNCFRTDVGIEASPASEG